MAKRQSAAAKANPVNEAFRIFARKSSEILGTPWAFIIAIGSIIAWALTGAIFDYSDTWQLIINTGTTVITFLMVFLIQNTQNRDSRTLQLKLDELLRVIKDARNDVIDLEDLPDEELERLSKQFRALSGHADEEKEKAAQSVEQVREAKKRRRKSPAKTARSNKPAA